MAGYTEFLKLFKYDPTTDSENVFSINQALNENWDKLDAFAESSGRNIGEIIQSTIPLTDAGLHLLDGSLIQGDGIYSQFVKYITDIYKLKNRTYNSTVFTKMGSPTVTSDGIASGFASGKGVNIKNFTLSSVNNFKIICSFTTKTIGTSQAIWTTNKYTTLMLSSTGYLLQGLSSNGTSNDIRGSATITSLPKLSANTKYWVETSWDGNTYKVGLSKDGITYQYTTVATSSKSILISPNTDGYSLFFGRGSVASATINSNYFTGSVDLKQFSIIANKAEVFSGSTPANYFTDETTWQQSITNYGVCGKFVYDSVNNTVRIPKYNNKIYTQDIEQNNAPVVGNGKGLTLTNGTVEYAIQNDCDNSACAWGKSSTNVGATIGSSSNRDTAGSATIFGVSTNPTKSGLIAQLSDITTSLEGYYYIVIATSTKTTIQVDIDEIVTDLNGKVDKSGLQEVQCVVETYTNGTSWYRVYSDGWCEQGGGLTQTGTITFLKPFINTNITLLLTRNSAYTGGISAGYHGSWTSVPTTTGFTCWYDVNTSYSWQACGYIA